MATEPLFAETNGGSSGAPAQSLGFEATPLTEDGEPIWRHTERPVLIVHGPPADSD